MTVEGPPTGMSPYASKHLPIFRGLRVALQPQTETIQCTRAPLSIALCVVHPWTSSFMTQMTARYWLGHCLHGHEAWVMKHTALRDGCSLHARLGPSLAGRWVGGDPAFGIGLLLLPISCLLRLATVTSSSRLIPFCVLRCLCPFYYYYRILYISLEFEFLLLVRSIIYEVRYLRCR
jgi:hypothetical protein